MSANPSTTLLIVAVNLEKYALAVHGEYPEYDVQKWP